MDTRVYRKSTITDVASAAGVSVSTVSAYVRGRRTVCSAETASRIDRAILDLHYSPGPAVRGSRDRSTHTIGSTLRDATSYEGLAADIMFHFRLKIGVQRVLQEHRLALLTYPWDAYHLVDYATVIDGRVDGVLFTAEYSDPRPEKIARAGLPIVVFERYKTIPEGCGVASASEWDVVQLALDHLTELGHRRIAHVSGRVEVKPIYETPTSTPHEFAIWRCRHYREYMADRGLYDPDLVFDGRGWRISEEHALSIVDKWRAMVDPPTAVFCANDRLAMGIIAAARQRGVRVPADLSVVGVDNEPASEAQGLTTVDIPLEEVGRAGTQALLGLMAGKPVDQCRPIVPVRNLMRRGSTSAPRERL